jgi:hypothetical protein
MSERSRSVRLPESKIKTRIHTDASLNHRVRASTAGIRSFDELSVFICVYLCYDTSFVFLPARAHLW